MTILRPFVAPNAKSWRTSNNVSGAMKFHRTLPGYAPTTLIDLPALAVEFGVARVMVKDESTRLALPAFKILGASWAIARAVAARTGLDPDALSLDALLIAINVSGVTAFVAATDGNHGRAVSRIAALLNRPAHIFIPFGVSSDAISAIESEGASVTPTYDSYDVAVARATEFAASHPSTLLIQDTSWEGYEEIPAWIVEGYQTLCVEIDEQLKDIGAPSVVVIPVGVGSLAEAVTRHYRGASLFHPALLIVEPTAAACLLASLHADQLTSVETSPTIMAGLNCGTPSASAWPILRNGVSAAIAVSDEEAALAVRQLNSLDVDSGPCGGASLAGLRIALLDEKVRTAMGVVKDSIIVLINTEGLAANPLPTEGQNR
ncbi:MAG TPA: diaminopropionate ammonia-lyase [Candidatus Nanopelagicaceae bacterium]